MRRLSLIFILLPMVTCSVIAVDFTPAELVEDLNPAMSTTSNPSRLEGWAQLSYIIDIDGKVKNIEIINASDKDDFYDESIRYLKNLRYSPALSDGKKVPSARPFLYGKNRYNNDGISLGFRNRYNRANEHLKNGELTQVKTELDDLQQTNTQNIKEQALSAWIHSQYYFAKKDWPAYGEQTKIAEILSNDLPGKWALTTMQNLMQWHLFKKEYVAAFDALDQIPLIEGAKISQAVYQTMSQDIFKALQQDTTMKHQHILEPDRAWLHYIARKDISINLIPGDQTSVELRCENNWLTLTEVQARAFSVSPDDINCAVIIKGVAGSEVSLTESGELYAFKTVENSLSLIQSKDTEE